MTIKLLRFSSASGSTGTYNVTCAGRFAGNRENKVGVFIYRQNLRGVVFRGLCFTDMDEFERLRPVGKSENGSEDTQLNPVH